MELTVLGIAWKRGPCTTYALMKELSGSTSTYYKSRAGTTYPLVDRLIKSGYLAQEAASGARGEKQVAATEQGIAALAGWLTGPVEPEEAAHTVDFLRLRVFYLGVVEGPDRLVYIDRALAALREHRAACEIAQIRYREMGDAFSEIATLGVIYEADARIRWMTEVRARMVDLPVGRPIPPSLK